MKIRLIRYPYVTAEVMCNENNPVFSWRSAQNEDGVAKLYSKEKWEPIVKWEPAVVGVTGPERRNMAISGFYIYLPEELRAFTDEGEGVVRFEQTQLPKPGVVSIRNKHDYTVTKEVQPIGYALYGGPRWRRVDEKDGTAVEYYPSHWEEDPRELRWAPANIVIVRESGALSDKKMKESVQFQIGLRPFCVWLPKHLRSKLIGDGKVEFQSEVCA